MSAFGRRRPAAKVNDKKGSGPSALESAFRLLSYRARSESELRSRLLEKGHSDSETDVAITRLLELGYINDAEVARSLVRRCRDIKQLGLTAARRFLRERGISDEVAREALEGYDEQAAAQGYLNKRKVRLSQGPAGDDSTQANKERRRLASSLMRRGHSPSTVMRALKTIKEDNNEET